MQSWEQATGIIVIAIMTQNRDLNNNSEHVNYMEINYQPSGLQIDRNMYFDTSIMSDWRVLAMRYNGGNKVTLIVKESTGKLHYVYMRSDGSDFAWLELE